jgi:serine/threonine protein kinase
LVVKQKSSLAYLVHVHCRTGFEENKDFPIVLNSVIAGRYYVTEYLGSAAFSKVAQAHDLQTGMDICLKIIKNDKDFFDQSLDEIKLLKFVNKYDPSDEHHVLRLYDYFYHQVYNLRETQLANILLFCLLFCILLGCWNLRRYVKGCTLSSNIFKDVF